MRPFAKGNTFVAAQAPASKSLIPSSHHLRSVRSTPREKSLEGARQVQVLRVGVAAGEGRDRGGHVGEDTVHDGDMLGDIADASDRNNEEPRAGMDSLSALRAAGRSGSRGGAA